MTRVLLPALLIATLASSLAAEDAVLDAKRAAAAKLLKDGKRADAQKLYEEIIGVDRTVYSDHLALARIYDKGGDTPNAVASYQTVVKLLGNGAKTPAERSSLAEAEKRLKTLDQVTQKLDSSISEFAEKLASLRKDAEKSKNAFVVDRIDRLLDTLDLPNRGKVVMVSAAEDWVDSGVSITVGVMLHIEAQGDWILNTRDPSSRCSADGNPRIPPISGNTGGILLAKIGMEGKPFPVGSKFAKVSDLEGNLYFSCNDTIRGDNDGSMRVLVRGAR